jgi:hypothetical protein
MEPIDEDDMPEPRILPPSNLNATTVLDMTAEEILLNLWIRFQSNISYANIFTQHLSDGNYGFTSNEQKDAIESIHNKMRELVILNGWIKQWMMKHHGDKFFFLEEAKDKESSD